MKYLIGIGALVVMCFIVFGMFIITYNKAVVFEETVIAAHQNSKNILGQHAPKIREAIGVQKLAPEALIAVFNAANTSRYGKDGSKAAMQWIKEQNPNLDQSQYGKIITMLEASRNDFMNAQTSKLDKVRAYRSFSRQFFTKHILAFMGMPSKVLDKETGKEVDFFEYYGNVVVSDHADKSFKTGIDNGVEIK